MEPFEWLILGIGVAVGSLLGGGRGKGVVRSAAKGYLVVEEKTREWTANMREDFRDAVEEARYERDREMNSREDTDEEEGERDEEPRREAHASGSRSATRSRAATKKQPAARSESSRGNGSREAQANGSENS